LKICIIAFVFTSLIRYNQAYSQLELERIVVNDRLHVNEKEVVLNAGTNSVLFELKPIPNAFYYFRVPQLNPKWTVSKYPVARFQNLPGGNYTFEIYSKANSKNSLVLKLPFKVKQTFWQQWYFLPSLIIYLLIFVGIGIYLFSLYNLRQKLKIQYVRNKIASDLHDEVGSNLNAIAIFVDLLTKKLPKNMPELLVLASKITNNSEETVSLMRDTVWAINPDNDSTEQLFEKLKSHGFEILSAKSIAFNLEIDEAILKSKFTMEQRKNIYLVFKESLNNIVKHAHATKVSCNVYSQNDDNHIEIIDNGIGFDLLSKHEGFGLHSFKTRNIDDELSITVSSQLTIGTIVLIEIL
jgi:signal transduction histidine kinase